MLRSFAVIPKCQIRIFCLTLYNDPPSSTFFCNDSFLVGYLHVEYTAELMRKFDSISEYLILGLVSS